MSLRFAKSCVGWTKCLETSYNYIHFKASEQVWSQHSIFQPLNCTLSLLDSEIHCFPVIVVYCNLNSFSQRPVNTFILFQ